MSGVLVNIGVQSSYKEQPLSRQTLHVAAMVACVQGTVPKEYTELVSAWTAFWQSVGSADICKACFASPRKGCCASCPNSATTGCVAKPVACATYGCGTVQDQVPERWRRTLKNLYNDCYDVLTGFYDSRRYARDGVLGYKYGQAHYAEAYVQDTQRVWTEKQLVSLRSLTRRVKWLTGVIKRTGGIPDPQIVVDRINKGAARGQYYV